MLDSRRYLDALFGDAVSVDQQIAIWDIPSKKASFHATVGAAEDRVLASDGTDADVYCGVGLYRPGIARGRGKAEDVVAITSLWADIDFGPAHKKPGIPPDEAGARAIITAITLAPSMVVDSGHGFHCYWGLSEPLCGPEATTLAKRWGGWIGQCAASQGHCVDSVFDLARVLRVPGTVNHKNGDSVPVKIAELSDRLYQPDDFEIYLPSGEAADSTDGAPAPVGFSIFRGAFPDAKMLDAALANDPKFKRTWEMRRGDFADQSASAYDMSLAVWAAQQGLDEQQTADLIIGFRTKHGHDLAKVLDRKDYLARTILRGKTSVGLGLPERQTVREHVSSDTFSGIEDNGGDVIEMLKSQLGIPIAGFIKRGRTNSRYAIVLEGGDEIAIGAASELLSAATFRHTVLDQTGHVASRMTSAVWDAIVRQMFKIVVEVEMPDGDDVVAAWLDDYLIARHPVPEESWPDALAMRMPFERDGRIHISLPDFRTWLNISMGERESAQNLRASMHRLGFAGRNVVTTIKGKQVGRWYWWRKNVFSSMGKKVERAG